MPEDPLPFNADDLLSAVADILNPGSRLNLALSGGSDSMVLLDLLDAAWDGLKNSGVDLRAIHIDHGIRGKDESDGDLDLVFQSCIERGVPLTVYRCPAGHVAAAAGELGGIEAAARRMRYRVLQDLSDAPGEFILTAHHRDDDIEQMFMSFFSGRLSADGIPSRSGRIIRPFLLMKSRPGKEDLLTRARQRHLAFAGDPSNGEDRFRRNLVRNRILPLIASGFGNPGVAMDSIRDQWAEIKGEIAVDSARWKPSTLYGPAVLSIPAADLEAVSPRQKRNGLRFSLNQLSEYILDWRIPSSFIDDFFSRAANGPVESEGYGLRLIREAGELFCIPSLAHKVKKGYFVALKPGGTAEIELAIGLILRLQRMDEPPVAGELFIRDASIIPTGQNFFFSQTKNRYLNNEGVGKTPDPPKWLIPLLPLVVRVAADGESILGFIAPDANRKNWCLYLSEDGSDAVTSPPGKAPENTAAAATVGDYPVNPEENLILHVEHCW